MFRTVLVAASVSIAACQGPVQETVEEVVPVSGEDQPEWRLVVHGGAGVILRENMTAEREAAYTAALETALEAGAEVLRNGGSAVDALSPYSLRIDVGG